jgi:hypothetical protein
MVDFPGVKPKLHWSRVKNSIFIFIVVGQKKNLNFGYKLGVMVLLKRKIEILGTSSGLWFS